MNSLTNTANAINSILSLSQEELGRIVINEVRAQKKSLVRLANAGVAEVGIQGISLQSRENGYQYLQADIAYTIANARPVVRHITAEFEATSGLYLGCHICQ